MLLKKFQTNKNYYVYNACTNNILEIGELIYNLIDSYNVLTDNELIQHFLPQYSESLLLKAIEKLSVLTSKDQPLYTDAPNKCIYHANDKVIGSKLDGSLQQVTLGLTENCNLKCSYCTYSGSFTGSRTHSEKNMTWDIAKKVIDYMATHTQNSIPPVALGFYGGEPLLKFDLIKRIVDYCKSTLLHQPLYTITTNGTLLTYEKAKFLYENNFSVLVSFDGPKSIHDQHRVFQGSDSGSFDVILRNLEIFREIDKDYFRRMVRLSMTMVPPIDFESVDKFVSEIGITPRISLVQTYGSTMLTKSDFDQEVHSSNSNYLKVKFIDAAVDGIFKKANISNEYLLCRSLYWGGLKKLCSREQYTDFEGDNFLYNNLCIPGASKLFVSSNGNFYTCEKVDSMNELCIGNIDTGIDKNKVIDHIHHFDEFRTKTCTNCWAMRLCSMCFATTYHFNGWDDEKVIHYCALQRREYENALKLYCSIAEKDETALDFMVELEA